LSPATFSCATATTQSSYGTTPVHRVDLPLRGWSEEMKKTFAERCKTMEQCLPEAPYREKVEALHSEMLGELEALRAENKRLKLAMPVPKYCDDHQEWAGMDGAIAFHLIERYGENWVHCGKLMDAWRNANPPGLALYGWLEAESSCNGAKPENMVGNASLIHSTRMHLSIHAPQKAVTTNPLFPVFIGPQRS